MSNLFRRLKAAGLDEGYVRAWLLPDWWGDEVAESPSGVAMAEVYISRMTGATIQSLRENGTPIIQPRASLRFKKRADADIEAVRPAAAIAEQVATGLVDAVREDLPAFGGLMDAAIVRTHILGTRNTVTLQALIDFAWDHGVIVAHLAELPAESRRIDGLAMFVGSRPVVILASGRDNPPWLAFHLAHELGHVFLGHVALDKPPLSDLSLDVSNDDPEEIAANRFALQTLTGDPDPTFSAVYGLTGARLARLAQREGPDRGIDPGVLALVYGWSASRMGAAQNALRILRDMSGAHEIVADGLRRHLREDLPESIQMLVDLVVEA